MTKRVIAALTAVVLAGAGVIGVPETIWATDYVTSADIQVQEGDDRDVSGNDHVDTVVSGSPIIINHGSIETVNASASVRDNCGSIDTNCGTVSTNRNSIVTNYGTVSSNLTGQITDNFGIVNGNTSTITNNYDNAIVGGGNAPVNQYWSVSFNDFDNGNAELTSGFTEKAYNSNGDTRQYLMQTNDLVSGVITLTPDENYGFTSNGNTQGTTNSCSYTLSESNGVYTVTITHIQGITELTLAQLNLVLSAIQEDPNVPANVVVRVDDSVKVSDSPTTADQPAALSLPITTNNSSLVTSAQIRQKIQGMIQYSLDHIDLGEDPSIDVEGMRALFEASESGHEIRCTFTHDGKTYVLIIPCGMTKLEYLPLLEAFKEEPNGQAGPLRISLIIPGVKIEEPVTPISEITPVAELMLTMEQPLLPMDGVQELQGAAVSVKMQNETSSQMIEKMSEAVNASQSFSSIVTNAVTEGFENDGHSRTPIDYNVYASTYRNQRY